MSGKFALIIGNTEYTDPGLAQLTSPGRDAEDFARVLKSADIAGFDNVITLMNENISKVNETVDDFFALKKPDDLLVFYFSGHGVRDEFGALYLAIKNTNRARLRSTAIRADYIRESMDQSRSKRQVLILDCCNSGAFAQGTKAEIGGTMGTATTFEGTGYGRVVLTASDATQFAWEGDKLIGETSDSLFTHFLVKGLEGEADQDGDGKITVDELYDYAYEQIINITPKQTPGKWSYKQQGEIVLRQSTRMEDIKPLSLPDQLTSEIENPYPEVRLRAVQQLAKLLSGKNLRLARSARDALEHIEKEDDSRRVEQAATQILESIRQDERLAMQKADEERKAKEESDRITAQKIEEERIARENAEAERKTKEELERRVREKVAAEWKAQEETNRLAAQKAEEERIAKVEAEGLAEEKRLVTERVETERLAAQKAEAERKTKEEVAREKAAQKAAQEKTEREEADREALKKLEHKAKEMETRARAEKRRQKYLELQNKTIHTIKLYYRHILLIAIAVTLVVLGAIFAPTLPLSVPTSISRPTVTSLPRSTPASHPGPTKTLIPTQIPTPTITPLPIVMTLYDEFNNKTYGGSGNFDSKKWAFYEDPGLTMIQQDGVLKLAANTGSCGASGCGAAITVVGTQPLSLTNAIEARMSLTNNAFSGSDFSVLLKIRADFPLDWFYACFMEETSNERVFKCSDSAYTHSSKRISIILNQYYTVRIEVDPSTATFRSYLNNELVDIYEPSSAAQLTKSKFIFSVVIAAASNTSGLGYIDKVSLGKPASP